MTDLELRPIDRSEFPAYYRSGGGLPGGDPADEDRESLGPVFEPERSLATFDAGDRLDRRDLHPGHDRAGRSAPGRRGHPGLGPPTHRRRGAAHGDDAPPAHRAVRGAAPSRSRRSGPPRAGSTAGSATASPPGSWPGTGRKDRLRIRPGVPLGTGRVVLARPENARPHEDAVYEALRPTSVGFLSRRGAWGDRLAADPARNRRRRHRAAARALHRGGRLGHRIRALPDQGQPRPRRGPQRSPGRLDVHATSPEAYAALWAYLVGIDLMP